MITYYRVDPSPIRVQPWRPSTFSPLSSMGQAPAPPAAPAPATPKSPLNVPLVLFAATGAGGVVGYLGTIAMGLFDKRFEVNAGKKTAGVVGGALGALLGTGVALLLKD